MAKQQRSDGKWFGFDAKVLAEKKQAYGTSVQFRAQYYNDPHDISSAPIKRDQFSITTEKTLPQRWTMVVLRKTSQYRVQYRLRVLALRKGDWSSIVVVGADGEGTTMF